MINDAILVRTLGFAMVLLDCEKPRPVKEKDVSRTETAQSASGVWSSKFPTPPGANGTIYAMTTYGTNLIVAGEFSRVAGARARGLAQFDGQTWSEFGGGVDLAGDGGVYSILADGADLY